MSKNLSSNALFHFTRKKTSLLNILENDFTPHYCIEDQRLIFDEFNTKNSGEVAIPMVCFCDIPLSKVLKHSGFYGKYAIGFTKEWGIRNGICPVLYAHPSGRSVKSIRTILKNENSSSEKDFLAAFVKRYEGKVWKGDHYSKKEKLFYDEKEWRYVPDINADLLRISKDEFLNTPRSDAYSTSIKDKKLIFKPADIKYIIVSKENQRLKIAKEIFEIKKYTYESDEAYELVTKIISIDQIKEDF